MYNSTETQDAKARTSTAYDGTLFFPHRLYGCKYKRYCVAEQDPVTGVITLHEFPSYASIEFAADWARHLALKHDPNYAPPPSDYRFLPRRPLTKCIFDRQGKIKVY